jgi:hypothetical protein
MAKTRRMVSACISVAAPHSAMLQASSMECQLTVVLECAGLLVCSTRAWSKAATRSPTRAKDVSCISSTSTPILPGTHTIDSQSHTHNPACTSRRCICAVALCERTVLML